MRAEQPVPVGERSILPGRMATAFFPQRTNVLHLDRIGDLAEGDVVSVVDGVAKAEGIKQGRDGCDGRASFRPTAEMRACAAEGDHDIEETSRP